MTTIAWDGKTLAADQQADIAGLKGRVTKIFRLNDGSLFTGSGAFPLVLAMKYWIENGKQLDKFPQLKPTSSDDWERCLQIVKGKVFLYEHTPFPIELLDSTFALGSGRDYAMVAMHEGYTAKKATVH